MIQLKEKDGKYYQAIPFKKFIELDNGKIMVQSYGKYKPNISFLFIPVWKKEKMYVHESTASGTGKKLFAQKVQKTYFESDIDLGEKEVFLLDNKDFWCETCKSSDFNLTCGNVEYMKGKYWKSSKGTDCFEIIENGPHIILRESWNGHGGRELSKENGMLFYKIASSNGGGTGYTYAIIEREWKKTLSEQEI
jgi:hypothetical protein